MAWILCHLRDGRLEVFDEVWLRDANTPNTLEYLFNRYSRHSSGFQFFGDAAARARKTSATMSDYIHILNHAGFKKLGRTVHYSPSNPLIADRFAATNALICNAEGKRRFFVDDKCEHLIRDLSVRSYKPGTKDPNDSGDVGHISDALGYIAYKLFPIKVQVGDRKISITSTRG
jgi:hypothetical protein